MPACRFCKNTGLELVSPMLDTAENVYAPCRCKYGQRISAMKHNTEQRIMSKPHPASLRDWSADDILKREG